MGAVKGKVKMPPCSYCGEDAPIMVASRAGTHHRCYAHEYASTAFACVECGKRWTTEDDPQEWAYGHDCEVE